MLKRSLVALNGNNFKTRLMKSSRFITTEQFESATNEPIEEQISSFLNSKSISKAFALLQEYLKTHHVIPKAILGRLYHLTASSRNIYYTHLFSQLITVNQTGKDDFTKYCGRVVKLHLVNRNWEPCLAFIREIELANNGELVLPYGALEALVLTAKWHNDVEIAFQAMKIMKEVNAYIYVRTWGVFLQLALDTDHHESLDWIYQKALLPGYLVLDDASYLRFAKAASQNGNLRQCEWASLRLRRRQRALGVGNPHDPLKLYICLIEAASQSSMINEKGTGLPGIQAVCRYLVRLGPLAGRVSVDDLPITVESLVRDHDSSEGFKSLFQSFDNDTSVYPETKSLVLNLLLCSELQKPYAERLRKCRALAFAGKDLNIKFNEDTILSLLEMAYQSGSDINTLHSLQNQNPTTRVKRKVKHLEILIWEKSLSN